MDTNETAVNNAAPFNLVGFVDTCRVCMSRSSEMSCLFDTEHFDVIDRIEFCTGVLLKVEKGLPSMICKLCLGDLSVAYKFKKSCLLANNMLRKFMNPVIKLEAIDHNMKQTYDEANESNFENYNGEGDNEGEAKVENVLLNTFSENNSSKIKMEKSDCTNKPRLRQTRKKREPSKKSKLMKSKKPQPVKKTVNMDSLGCRTCDVKFDNKETSITHKKNCHKDTECWVCEICGKMFVHRASHYSHVRSHAPPQFSCAQCDYKTWYKHDLIKHVRRHDGIKLYQCEYCTASYYTSSNLINHIRRIHVGEKRYQCTMCDKRFYDRTKLNRHIDSHNDVKRFKCEVCAACFSRRCYWKKHLLRQHNVVAPPQRPGRQNINFLVGLDLIDSAAALPHQ